MARLSAVQNQTPDPTAINLTRLLSRLEQILLADTPEYRAARASSFERTKIATNLEYARSLLLRLERETLAIKTLSRKQSLQGDLLGKKELVKRLNERLHELNQVDDVESGDDNEEDLLGNYTPSESNQNTEDETADSISEDRDPSNSTTLDRQRSSFASNTPDSEESNDDRLPHVSMPSHTPISASNLRSRRLHSDATEGSTHTMSSEVHPVKNTTSTTETLLTSNRMEQETLTASLLAMASALKESSHLFADSLESEKEILGRAGEGLDKNAQGMDAAGKRMGTLRRMTEGQGWLGRMMMYAWIAGLMIVALILVGFMPKLRF